MQQAKAFLSYFDPSTSKYEGAWETFDSCLTFKQQLITITLTALAALVSLPILGLGGLATFRALVNRYVPYDAGDLPDTSAGSSAGRTNDAGQRTLNALDKDQFIEEAKRLFVNEAEPALVDEVELGSILGQLFEQYKNGRVLLTALNVGTVKERFELLKDARKLDGDMDSPQEFLKLIRFLNKLPSDRENYIDRLVRFGAGLTKASEFQQVHQALLTIPADEEEEVVEASETIAQNFPSAPDRAKCLQAVQVNLPKGERVRLMETNAALLSTISSSFLLPECLVKVQSLTDAKRASVTPFVERLRSSEDDGTILKLTLDCVADVPDEISEQLLGNIGRCLHGLEGENLLPVVQILRHISTLSVADRINVVAAALTHIRSTMHPIERRLILSALCSLEGDLTTVDADQLKELVRLNKLMSQFISKLGNTANKQQIMAEIQKIPEDQRPSILSAISPVLSRVTTAGEFKELVCGVKMIAPDYRKAAIEKWNQGRAPRFSWLTIVRSAFADNVPAQIATKEYLYQLLRTETDQEVALDIARRIWDNLRTFGINEAADDEFFTLLMGIVPIAHNNLDSPYVLYRVLMQQDRQVKTPEVAMRSQKVAGLTVKMNQPHFEKMIRESKRLTFGELDPPINLDTITQLFTDLESRLDRLSGAEQNYAYTHGVSDCQVIDDYFDNRRRPSLETAKRNYYLMKRTFLGSSYIRDTLNLRGGATQAVPTGYLHIYAVIKYIMESSKEIQRDSGLTAQEETLLRMVTSIQNCSTGKSEGFAAFYSQLPAEYRSHAMTEASTNEEKCKAYLGTVIEGVLSEYLSHNNLGPMAQELIGSDRDGQFVHTSKYLKNLIGKRVGMPWDVSFDAYTGCINRTLKGRSLEDVLRIFYKHFTPEEFARRVLLKINQNLVPNREEIEAIDIELKAAKEALAAKMREGRLQELQDSLAPLKGQISAAGQQKQKTRQLLERQRASETQSKQLKQVNIDRFERNLADETAALTKLVENEARLKQEFEAEKERLGVKPFAERVAAVRERMDQAHEKLNQEFVDLFPFLLGARATHECFKDIDSTEEAYELTLKGVVNALIAAGYLAE